MSDKENERGSLIIEVLDIYCYESFITCNEFFSQSQ